MLSSITAISSTDEGVRDRTIDFRRFSPQWAAVAAMREGSARREWRQTLTEYDNGILRKSASRAPPGCHRLHPLVIRAPPIGRKTAHSALISTDRAPDIPFTLRQMAKGA
jgi:hypothetical protein